jgi:hypothetical protein
MTCFTIIHILSISYFFYIFTIFLNKTNGYVHRENRRMLIFRDEGSSSCLQSQEIAPLEQSPFGLSYRATPSGLVKEVVLDKVWVKHWEYK